MADTPRSEPPQKLVTPLSLTIDAVLVVAFFFFMYSVVKTHVQSHDPKWIMLWGGLTALMFAALFWLALQMFRVVLRFQLQQRAARNRK